MLYIKERVLNSVLIQISIHPVIGLRPAGILIELVRESHLRQVVGGWVVSLRHRWCCCMGAARWCRAQS